MKYFYRIHGLNIGSEVCFNGLKTTDNNPDVTIELGKLPDTLDGDSRVKPSFSYNKNQYLLYIPELIKIMSENGNRIIIDNFSIWIIL